MNKECESGKPKEQLLSHYLRDHLKKSGVEVLTRIVKLESELLLYKSQNMELRKQLDEAQAQLARNFEIPADISKVSPSSPPGNKANEQLSQPAVLRQTRQLIVQQQLSVQEQHDDKTVTEKGEQKKVEKLGEDRDEKAAASDGKELSVLSMQPVVNNANVDSNSINGKKSVPSSPIQQVWTPSHTNASQSNISNPTPASASPINVQQVPFEPDPTVYSAFAEAEPPKQTMLPPLNSSVRGQKYAPKSRFAVSPPHVQMQQQEQNMQQSSEGMMKPGQQLGYGRGNQIGGRGGRGGYNYNRNNYGNRTQQQHPSHINVTVNQTQGTGDASTGG